MEEMHREDCTEPSEKEGVVNKEIRRRKKRLLHQITNQMDFYFSSANITKDKFMSDLLCHDPYINLETFFKFNKIRAMTSDLEFLRKAITKSSVLELSDDGMRVRRKEEEKPKDDELQCTIYVENVPSNADHEWVREVFGEYGTIDYISLPRYHRSGRPKGFAFVEFKTPGMANSALEAFGALECKIPPTTDPAELQSIKTFEGNEEGGEEECNMGGDMGKESSDGESKNKRKIDWSKDEEVKEINKEGINQERKENDGVTKRNKSSNGETVGVEVGSMKKRKISSSEEERKETKENNDAGSKEESKEGMKRNEDDDTGTKEGTIKIKESKGGKMRENDNPETKEGLVDEIEGKKRKLDATDETEEKKKRKRTEGKTQSEKEDEEDMEEGKEQEEHVTGGGKKKKRKRKRKKKEKEVIDSIYLRVMSKEDWKRLRNKYLNAQRENMKVLKMQMQEEYRNYHHHHHHHHHYHQPLSKRQTGDSNVRFETEELRNKNRMGDESLKREDRTRKDDWKSHDVTGKKEEMGMDYIKGLDGTGKNYDGMQLETGKFISKKDESLKPQFTPNSVIKISFEEPPHDVKKLRETIREGGGGGVAYVDLSATERDVYVRFTSSNGASAYKSAGCWSRMELLSGEEEEEYWRRIITCWTERRNKKNKNKRGQSCGLEMRGREKLLQKAFQDAQNTRKCNSHIVFDD